MTDAAISNVPTKWNETVLWQRLMECGKPDAHEVTTVLETWMPDIDRVLMSGSTSPKDFTLHDDQHALRVANRMVEIMPEETLSGLSPYELAFLLLSAYLHDIGMTPEYRKVSLHYQYLLTGDQEGLAEEEIGELQEWLDDDQEGVTPPLCSGTPTPDELSLANRLVAHYCRHRHNDWSAEWILDNAPRANGDTHVSLGTFTDWVDELVRLCQSHHDGRSQLESAEFSPRLVGQRNHVLHLRYLACVLRVADVLELDPERTPDVILSHRDVDPGSLIYWHKDHGISLTLDDNRYVVAARPSSARLYRAVEETLDQIDTELLLCRTLADNTHFHNCPGLIEHQPYRWKLSPAAHRDLEPKPNTFVYIDSSFRPNTHKLLQLFSGTELYGNPLAAIRELLQNAFDAVREQIAHQRLQSQYPASSELEESLGKQHRVELRLEQRNDGYWLVCSDSGVGMNKRIIENYLLVSGQSQRHDIAALERRCKKAGFTTGRTGQFGIGVLSYFMIADRVGLSTRRSMEPGDHDATGWIFETEGVGSWGELRTTDRSKRGTRVELHLKGEVIHDAAAWYASVANYLRNSLVYVSCEFNLNSELAGCKPLTLDPGWTNSRTELASIVLEGLRHKERNDSRIPRQLLSSEAQAQKEQRDQRWRQLRDKARQCLQWMTQEGELPGGLGRYRLHLPYFDLPGGPSLLFMDIDEREDKRYLGRIGKGCSYPPTCPASHSWKGIAVHVSRQSWADTKRAHRRIAPLRYGNSSVCMEVDFRANVVGQPEVNRSVLILNETGSNALEHVHQEVRDLIQKFVIEHLESSYALLNTRYGKVDGLTIEKPEWISHSDPNPEYSAIWGRVRFPVVDNAPWMYSPLPEQPTWKGKDVSILPYVGGPDDERHHKGIFWNSAQHMCPDRVLAVKKWFMSVGLLWERNPLRLPRSEKALVAPKFPPLWKQVVGIRTENRPAIWNRVHRLVKMVTDEARDSVRSAQASNSDPLAFQDDLLRDPAQASAWLMQMLLGRQESIWKGLIERDPDFLHDLWTVVFGKHRKTRRATPLVYWDHDLNGYSHSGLHVVDPDSWRKYREGTTEFKQYMPDPGPDWTLEVNR